MTIVDPATRVVRNSMILILARLLSVAAGVVTVPVLLGGLGAEAFGVWVLLNGLAGFLAYLDLGLGSAQTREVARALETASHRRARAVLAIGAAWSFGFGGLALVLGTVAWPLVAFLVPHAEVAASRPAFVVILLAFWVSGMMTPWRSILEGAQSYRALATVDCGTAILAVAVSTGIVYAGGRLTALAIGAAVVAVMHTGTVAAIARRQIPMLTPSPRLVRRSDVTETLRYGLPVQATGLAMAVNLQTDRLVLGAFAGPATVAAYEPGSRVANLFRLPVLLVMVVAFPAVSQVAAGGRRDRLDGIYLRMTRWLATFAAVGGAALVVSADPLIRLWLGRPLPLAAATLALLSAGYVVNLAVGAAALTARAEGQPGRETRSAAAAASLNVLLAFPLLKLVGPWGVPLSTAVATSVGSGYFLVQFHRRSGRSGWLAVRALTPPGLAAVTAISLTFAVAGSLPDGPGRAGAASAVLCRVGLAASVVLAILVALRYLDATDLARLRRVLGWQRHRQPTVPALQRESR